MSTDRIILHESIADAFLAIMKGGISAMAASGPVPKLVSSTSKSRLQQLVSDALFNGAEQLDMASGNIERESSTIPNDTAFVPVVIGNVQPSMNLWQEEAFGPVVCYVTAQTEDKAIELVNASEYGLTAAVFTRDLRKGLAIAKRLETG